MRVHPKVIGEKFSKGIFVDYWRNLDPDFICCKYKFDLGIGEERYKKCVGQSGGPISIDWWDMEEINLLSDEELAELENICHYKIYIDNVLNEKNVYERIASLFLCNPNHVKNFGVKRILELCNLFYNLSLELHSKNRNDILTYKYIDKKSDSNPFKILGFDAFKARLAS